MAIDALILSLLFGHNLDHAMTIGRVRKLCLGLPRQLLCQWLSCCFSDLVMFHHVVISKKKWMEPVARKTKGIDLMTYFNVIVIKQHDSMS
jgi:hypothetical protein